MTLPYNGWRIYRGIAVCNDRVFGLPPALRATPLINAGGERGGVALVNEGGERGAEKPPVPGGGQAVLGWWDYR